MGWASYKVPKATLTLLHKAKTHIHAYTLTGMLYFCLESYPGMNFSTPLFKDRRNKHFLSKLFQCDGKIRFSYLKLEHKKIYNFKKSIEILEKEIVCCQILIKSKLTWNVIQLLFSWFCYIRCIYKNIHFQSLVFSYKIFLLEIYMEICYNNNLL